MSLKGLGCTYRPGPSTLLLEAGLTLSLPAVAADGGGGDGGDGDASDSGRDLHLEHLAGPGLVRGAGRQGVPHGVPHLRRAGTLSAHHYSCPH